MVIVNTEARCPRLYSTKHCKSIDDFVQSVRLKMSTAQRTRRYRVKFYQFCRAVRAANAE